MTWFDELRKVLTNFDKFEPFWTSLIQFWQVWTIFHQFDQNWWSLVSYNFICDEMTKLIEGDKTKKPDEGKWRRKKQSQDGSKLRLCSHENLYFSQYVLFRNSKSDYISISLQSLYLTQMWDTVCKKLLVILIFFQQ